MATALATLDDPSALTERLQDDATLAGDLQFLPRRRGCPGGTPTVFLTGGTGFLGANLLSDLLTRTAYDVRCLVRVPRASLAATRVRRALARQGLWRSSFASRIQVVPGDLGLPRFGLSTREFSAAGQGVAVFLHAAAQVNLALPYDALRATNVEGTHELLRLASLGGTQAFHYVSSIAALRGPRVCGAESRGDNGSQRQVPGYAVTKWVAEQLVSAAGDRGLAVSISRPGRIAGHSTTAAYNQFDLFALLVAASLKLRAVPLFSAVVHLTPVDVISRFIVEVSLRDNAPSHPFHLVNPSAVDWDQVVQALRSSGRVSECVSYAEWRDRVRRAAADDPGARHLRLLNLSVPMSPPPLSTSDDGLTLITRAAAHDTRHGISYPNPRLLVDRYIERIAKDVASTRTVWSLTPGPLVPRPGQHVFHS